MSTELRLLLAPGLPPLSPSLRSNLLNLEVLLLPPLLLRRRRALDGGALPDLPHRTCGSTVERSCVRSSFEGIHGDQDLFVGVFTFTLLQLSIKSSAAREVHPLNGCKKVTRSIYPCLHLPRSVLGFGFRSAGKFLFSTPNPNRTGLQSFTSGIPLGKRTRCWVNKLQLGN